MPKGAVQCQCHPPRHFFRYDTYDQTVLKDLEKGEIQKTSRYREFFAIRPPLISGTRSGLKQRPPGLGLSEVTFKQLPHAEHEMKILTRIFFFSAVLIGLALSIMPCGASAQSWVSTRNLNLTINNIRLSSAPTNRICVAAFTSSNKEYPLVKGSMTQCEEVRGGENQHTFRVENLPIPAYLFVFHDENKNNVLDFQGSVKIFVSGSI